LRRERRDNLAAEFVDYHGAEARTGANAVLVRTGHPDEAMHSNGLVSPTVERAPAEAAPGAPAHHHPAERTFLVQASTERPSSFMSLNAEDIAALFGILSRRAEAVTAQGPVDVPPTSEPSETATALMPEPGGPLAGLLPLDVETLQRNVDAFFSQLSDLVQGPGGGPSVRGLVPWMLFAGAVVWELILLPRVLRRSGPLAADPLALWTEVEP
jgi:hypothetical protein